MSNLEIFHGSHSVVTEIKNTGVYGGLFGHANAGVCLSHGDVLHVITINNLLTDYEMNYSIEGAWETALEIAQGDEEVAEAMMEAGCPAAGSFDGLEIQGMRGELARRLGFDSVEMEDEHGTSYLCNELCAIRVATEEDRENGYR